MGASFHRPFPPPFPGWSVSSPLVSFLSTDEESCMVSILSNHGEDTHQKVLVIAIEVQGAI